MTDRSLTGLVLTGGGARGAYQAGVLKAISEITSRLGISQPFPVLTGTSAGAINATFLAAQAENMHAAITHLCELWSSLRFEQVYETGSLKLANIGMRVAIDVSLGGFYKRKMAHSLFDTAPLRELVSRTVSLGQIQKNIEQKILRAIAVTAVNYNSASTVTFFQGSPEIAPWERVRRKGERAKITPDHIMASVAIPLLFPPVRIGKYYYGDGSLRHYTPLSPPIQLGADKLVIIAVRKETPTIMKPSETPTNFARVLNVILNSILLDAVELDYERLSRINRTLQHVRAEGKVPLRPIEAILIRPSEDIGQMARKESWRMPRAIHHLIKGLGTEEDAADMISNLLFDPRFTQQLVDLGYSDAMARADEIRRFYQSPHP